MIMVLDKILKLKIIFITRKFFETSNSLFIILLNDFFFNFNRSTIIHLIIESKKESC